LVINSLSQDVAPRGKPSPTRLQTAIRIDAVPAWGGGPLLAQEDVQANPMATIAEACRRERIRRIITTFFECN
jgi:hypothetical protein